MRLIVCSSSREGPGKMNESRSASNNHQHEKYSKRRQLRGSPEAWVEKMITCNLCICPRVHKLKVTHWLNNRRMSCFSLFEKCRTMEPRALSLKTWWNRSSGMVCWIVMCCYTTPLASVDFQILVTHRHKTTGRCYGYNTEQFSVSIKRPTWMPKSAQPFQEQGNKPTIPTLGWFVLVVVLIWLMSTLWHCPADPTTYK